MGCRCHAAGLGAPGGGLLQFAGDPLQFMLSHDLPVNLFCQFTASGRLNSVQMKTLNFKLVSG